MRCSASPTICTASEPVRAPAPSPEAGAVFSTILFKLAFAPLAKPLGFYGDVALDACARTMARADGPLGAVFAAAFPGGPAAERTP